MYPLYIPSMNRQNSEFLIKIRDITPKIKYYIIIAKHQYENYAKNYPLNNLVILPDGIIKISEIRQFILELARKNKESKIWMSDDDLSKFFIKKSNLDKFYQLNNQKNQINETKSKSIENNSNNCKDNVYKLCEVSFMDYILTAESIFDKISILDRSIVQFGFKYSTFAIPTKPITLNTNIGMIQLLDIKKTKKINYDLSFTTLEDTDFTIQLLKNNLKSCQLNHFIFTAPKSGTGKGGLEGEYSNGAKQKGITEFFNKYPDLIEITDIKKGKYKIKWNKFKMIDHEVDIISKI